MPTIALLVTGKTEFRALADSLGRVFPASFRYVNSSNADPEGHLRGFTSRDCKQLLSAAVAPESDLA